MTDPRIVEGVSSRPVHDFADLRAALELPARERTDEFPADVVAEADRLAALAPDAPADRTDVPFVTIDPPAAMDLDQAVALERLDGGGFRVHYAIADLGSVIELGSAIDLEARRRGQTIYLPDGRVPLHPPVLSEGVLSLLPDQRRRAALWTIEVTRTGEISSASVERALVTSVARLDYAGVQRDADAGRVHPSIEALPDLGELRRTVRLAAGAIDLALPAQEVVPDGDDWTIRIEPRNQVDAWNAEVSLLTGMAAADMMLRAEVGLLRYLPDPDAEEVDRFRDLITCLGISAPAGASAGTVLSGLDQRLSTSLAAMSGATRLLRGAGYVAFDGAPPENATHAGIGGAYAHVTAPLRRLADRFGTEVCLALSAGETVPEDLRAVLPQIADAMRDSDHRSARADREAINRVEVWIMQDHGEQTFDAVVLRGADGDRPAEIMVVSPPVVASCSGEGLTPGASVTVRVEEIDVEAKRVRYATC